MENTKKAVYTLAILVTIAVVVILFYWIKGIIPNELAIKEGASSVKPVDRNILSNATVKKIEGWQKFGNIPVNLSAGDIGKSNPFN